MKRKPKLVRIIITYLTAYLLTFSTVIRSQSDFKGIPFETPVIIPLVIFAILFVIEPLLSRQSHLLTHIYLGIQVVVVSYLILIPPHADYFAVLFVVIIMQAIYVMPERIGLWWVAAITLIMIGLLLYGHGFAAGIGYIINYILANLIISGLLIFSDRAESARNESQRLLVELQAAHEKLQAYTAQAEELAGLKERSKLARDLHDSVTQTIYSMTLTTEATRHLLDRDPSRVPSQMDMLQELSKNALAEMRSLIFELRPTAAAEIGLVQALRSHFQSIEKQSGLSVTFDVVGETDITGDRSERLFRIIQEALNNVVKHAQVDEASVTLRFEDEVTSISIEDQGQGFNLETLDTGQNQMGLSSMRERVDMLGGTLSIDSQPGIGTSVKVLIPATKNRGVENG